MSQKDRWAETRELLNEERAKYIDAVQALTGNWAKIASVAVVVLSYIQYSYKYGICMAFNLPFSVVTIKLADFIPSAALLCFIAFYVFDFYIVLNPMQSKEPVRFSLHRVLCGTIIDYITLNMIFNDDNKNLILLLLISLVPPLIVELILKLTNLRRAKERLMMKYRDRIENDTEERLFYKHFVKPFLICIMALILLIPWLSVVVVKNRDVYEVCTVGEDTFAVIFNNTADYVVIQPAVIEGDSLTIYTDSYKNSMKAYVDSFSFRQFDRVTIKDRREPESN